MIRSSLLAIVAALVMLGATPTSAQTVCGDRSEMVEFLARNYQESRIGVGVNARGAVIEVFASNTGTWSILVTVPGGPTCVISEGDGWVVTPSVEPTLFGTKA